MINVDARKEINRLARQLAVGGAITGLLCYVLIKWIFGYGGHFFREFLLYPSMFAVGGYVIVFLNEWNRLHDAARAEAVWRKVREN